MFENYFQKLVGNPVAILSGFLLFLSYVVIVAFYSGSWWLLNLRLNSNTKKAKSLLKKALYTGGFAILILIFVSPFFNKNQSQIVKNPYLGRWVISESTISNISDDYLLRIYINEENRINGDIATQNGKNVAYLRSINLNHNDYAHINGKYSSELGDRYNFRSKLYSNTGIISVIDKKDDLEVGIFKIDKE